MAIAWKMAMNSDVSPGSFGAIRNTHTSRTGLVAKVLRLVPLDKTLRLGRRSWPSGELLVELHHLLHAYGILSGAETLLNVRNGPRSQLAHASIDSCANSSSTRSESLDRNVFWIATVPGCQRMKGRDKHLRKEKQSARSSVSRSLQPASTWRRTFGGMRVERARLVTKLIVASCQALVCVSSVAQWLHATSRTRSLEAQLVTGSVCVVVERSCEVCVKLCTSSRLLPCQAPSLLGGKSRRFYTSALFFSLAAMRRRKWALTFQTREHALGARALFDMSSSR